MIIKQIFQFNGIIKYKKRERLITIVNYTRDLRGLNSNGLIKFQYEATVFVSRSCSLVLIILYITWLRLALLFDIVIRSSRSVRQITNEFPAPVVRRSHRVYHVLSAVMRRKEQPLLPSGSRGRSLIATRTNQQQRRMQGVKTQLR